MYHSICFLLSRIFSFTNEIKGIAWKKNVDSVFFFFFMLFYFFFCWGGGGKNSNNPSTFKTNREKQKKNEEKTGIFTQTIVFHKLYFFVT